MFTVLILFWMVLLCPKSWCRGLMPAIAITDHGVTYGLVEFVSEAQRLGIKPIVGVEGYIKNHFTSFYLLKTPLALET